MLLVIWYDQVGEGGATPDKGPARRTEVMPCVFDEEEEDNLRNDGLPCREGNLPSLHSEGLRQWVEQPNLGTSREILVEPLRCICVM